MLFAKRRWWHVANAVVLLGGFRRQYTQCYVYLSQLEKLNIPYTLELFLNSPKEGMIKGLWKNHSHEPKVFFSPSELALLHDTHRLSDWLSNFSSHDLQMASF